MANEYLMQEYEDNKRLSNLQDRLEQIKIEQTEGPNDQPFKEDLMRFAVDLGAAIPNLALDTAEYFGADVSKPREFLGTTMEAVITPYADIAGIDPREIVDRKEAKSSEYESGTGIGTGLEIASLIQPTKAVTKLPLLRKLPAAIKEVTAGSLVYSALFGDEKNISEVLLETDKDLIQQSETGEGFLPKEGFGRDVVEFFATDKDDTAAERRMKATLEGMLVGGVTLGTIMGPIKAVQYAKKVYNKRPSNLTPEEAAELSMNYLRDAREATEYRSTNVSQVGFSETPETIAQVAQQNSGPIRRFLGQMFTSRGYWTAPAYNAFNEAQYAQRQIVAQAEHISNRLQKSLRSLGDEAATAEASKNAQNALESKLSFHPLVSREAQVNHIMTEFNLPKEAAEEVLNARNLIDDMSAQLANSSIPNEEFRTLIQQNSGEYIRRSYRLFEDSGYKPSESVRQNAVEYLRTSYMKSNKNLTLQEADELALGKVDEILKEGADATDVFDYYSKVRRVNTEILKGRKDIPEPIRQLMGEIEEPAENIILTVSKMAKLNETNKFFESFHQLGRNKYLFTDPIERNGVKFDVQITGTNSVLDGKYTTSEMMTAIKERESVLIQGPNSGLTGLLRNFAAMKGRSQAAKTIYSHVTHLRNILGGAQFGIANGANPFSSGSQTMQVLKNRLTSGGQAELDAMYEDYLKYGIINTNVRVNEFRALLETGYESKADTLLENLSRKLPGYGAREKVTGAAAEFYMAVDDFYKINNFEKELETLRKAFPDQNEEVLKSEAARIVQNTFPNYDRVPKGIKATRYLPVGNFVAFPTEMWRTSGNILLQASKEISSGNPTLVARGTQRLAGFGVAMTGFGGMANYTAQVAGFTEEEADAIQTLSQTPWSKAPRNIIRGEDGTIYTNDTQFIDSYSTIKAPFVEIVDAIQKGELTGKPLEQSIATAVLESTKTVLAPYVEESMLTKALTDVASAYNSEDGRTPEGKLLFNKNKPGLEQLTEATAVIIDAFLPGSFTSLESLGEAAFEKPNPRTGRPKNFEAELATNLTGVRFAEFNPVESVEYAAKNYQNERRNIPKVKPDFAQSPSSLYSQYIAQQENNYRLQQELYLKLRAGEVLLGQEGVIEVLLDTGFSKKEAGKIMSGYFSPTRPSSQFIQDVIEMTPGEFEDKDKLELEIFSAYADMESTLLVPAEDNEDELMADFEELRARFAKGGEVSVPQAPVEPDERIDKMTGLPYNQQAGAAFMDEEDMFRALMMSCGGHVRKRIKKFEGGVAKMLGINPDDVKWAKELGKKFGEAEELDGRGDAARHLALGWLAKNSDYPSFAKFAADAREVVSFDFKGAEMDWANNEKGFEIDAEDKAAAEKRILEMIDNNEALFMTPKESKEMRGY